MKKKLFFSSFLLIAHFSFGQFIQRGTDINGEAENDQSGWAVSIDEDGNTIAIGAPFNDGNGNNSGHVRVYSFNGAAWVQQGADIDGQVSEDQSGYAVSLSADGSIVAIGAPFNSGNGDDSGHVRVYSFDGAAWTPRGDAINGENAGDRSGWAISLSDDGNRIAIGAPNNGGNGINSGHVRVYEYDVDNGVWVQLGFDIDGPTAGNLYGTAISLNSNGTRLAVGAPTNGDNGVQSGHIRIYEFNGVDDWVQLGADINGDGANSYLGKAVSLNSDGTRLAVGGGPLILGDGLPALGYTRVYEYDGVTLNWVQLGADIDGEQVGDRSGTSVSLSGDGSIVAIGAPFNNNANGFSGQFRLYEFDGANWAQQGEDVDGEADSDSFGYAVGLSNDGATVVAGAISNSEVGDSVGHARVYVNTVLSTEEPGLSASLRLYPNPNSSVATITLPHTGSTVTVKVNDAQ
ncbi:MAG: FG-GAP repeat protein, partial [Bacteroidota bacterium]